MPSLCLLLIFITCSFGEPLPSPEKIVNGKECYTEDFPYVVSIRVGNPLVHMCGGSLVDGYNVLTAAHCYETGWRYHVVAGQTHLQEFSEEIQTQLVAHVFIHPLFNKNKTTNDVAIFRLRGKIRETLYTKYVQLPPRDGQIPCSHLRTAGWGRLIDDDITKLLPFNLRCVQLAIINPYLCRMYYKNLEMDISFCTMEKWSQKGVCFGDSGGPMMCEGVQYGIVSWGVRCFGPVPQVHTNVSVYAGFIMHMVASHACLSPPHLYALYVCMGLCNLLLSFCGLINIV